MPISLRWFVILSALTVLLYDSTNAQTQKRNFNLSCGLIGSFARYPQHVQGCKPVVLCTDPKTCVRKIVRQKDLEAILSSEDLAAPAAGESPQSDTSGSGLSLSVGVDGNVSAGGLSASGSASAEADSRGGASGSASGGVSAGAGGVNAGAGGSLGIGGNL